VAAEGFGVGKQYFAMVYVFGLQIVVVKFIHHQFRHFENAKTYGNWFIHSDTLTCRANEREIIIDDFSKAKSRSTHRLRQLIWVTNQAKVNTMPDLSSRIRIVLLYTAIFAKNMRNSTLNYLIPDWSTAVT